MNIKSKFVIAALIMDILVPVELYEVNYDTVIRRVLVMTHFNREDYNLNHAPVIKIRARQPRVRRV